MPDQNSPNPVDIIPVRIEEIFKALFESAAEGLLVINGKGRIVISNPRLQELFGYEEEELMGKPVEFLIPERYRRLHEVKRGNYLKDPVRRSMGSGLDLWAQRKDKTEFPVEISLNHFEAADERYAMALITDISTRKQVERKLAELNAQLESRVQDRTRALRESQRLYSLIARNFPSGTINVFDADLRYLFVEGRELYQMGVTSAELVGTNYLDRVPAELRVPIQKKLFPVFSGQGTRFEVESGGIVFELTAVPLPDDEGNITQILVVEQNITKQKKAEMDIREALDKERQLNELKSGFVSMASHEFRTPLSTILTSVSLIAKYTSEEQAEKREKHIERIRSSVQNLTNILNEFLSLDRLENGRVEPEYEDVDLPEFLRDVVEEMQEIARKNQYIAMEIEGPPLVRLDLKMLRNILINLISNAIKFSPESSRIELSARREEDKLNISVQDHGMGIPKANQDHIFNRFFRAGNVTHIQGTGLGLNIVRRYLDLMGGSIYFRSIEGEGTTFYLEIPQGN